MRKRVYIAGPISKGSLADNIQQAEAAFFELASAGFAPFCPHWSCYSTGPIEEETMAGKVVVTARATVGGGANLSHADWLAVDLPWVAVADAVLRLPGESVGADKETTLAAIHGVPVFHSVADVQEFFAHDRTHSPPDGNPHQDFPLAACV